MSFNTKDYKGFTFRSGASKNKTTSFSSFWDTSYGNYDVDEFLGNDTDRVKGKDVVALAGYKRAISNFVSIVTGKHIPVVFNSKDESYTDGRKVVIGSNIDDKKFDVAVGLALHEASHIKLSNFSLLKNLEISIPAELFVLADKKGVSRSEIINLVKSVLNYIEDRRIDNFIFTTSPGYKGYYHSMYDKYFYSKNVDKGLLSSEFRMENIESYMFRIINLHNKNRQLGALKSLKEIYRIINLRSINRLNSSDAAFDVATEVVTLIINTIDKVKLNDKDEADGKSGNQTKTSADGESSDGENLSDEEFNDLIDSVENGEMETGDGGGSGKSIELPSDVSTPPTGNISNDDGSESVELSDRQKELLKKAFEKQEKFLDGDVQKTLLSKKDNNAVKSVEDSGATYENVGDGLPNNWYTNTGKGTKCLVVRNLTQKLIDTNMFGCATAYSQNRYNGSDSYYRSYDFVEEGLRLGSILGRKLQIRGEESVLKYTRKDTGKIDKRLISELGFNNTNVFSQTFVERFNKAYLHISIDASGSMSGDKWNKAMTSAIAMIKACDMAGNIDVVVSIRATYQGNGPRAVDVPLIMVVYDSRKDKLIKVKTLFPALDVTGTTPEGLCFEAIEKELIPGNNNQDSYFINYSDGAPMFQNNEISYSGREAYKHTAKMVGNMKAKGIRIMSYFIGSSSYSCDRDNTSFKAMYGGDASFINATNMMQVAKTMNKKFLSK